MEKKQYESALKIIAIACLAMAAFKCHGQTFRISTAQGLVVSSESNDPDEICLSFGVLTSDVCGMPGSPDLKNRLAYAVKMADEAGVDYETFLRENGMKDTADTRAHYIRGESIRNQFLSIMSEQVFLEIRQITQYFQ